MEQNPPSDANSGSHGQDTLVFYETPGSSNMLGETARPDYSRPPSLFYLPNTHSNIILPPAPVARKLSIRFSDQNTATCLNKHL